MSGWLESAAGINRMGNDHAQRGGVRLKFTGGARWPADRREVAGNREMMQAAPSADEFAKAQKTGEAMNDEIISARAPLENNILESVVRDLLG